MSVQAEIDRDKRRFWARKGSSHDRTVKLLQIVLPAAVGALGAMMLFVPFSQRSEISFLLDKNKVDVANERLRVERAEYRGRDAKGQAFVLQAGSAVQKSSAEPIVRLRDMVAAIDLADGPATLTAPEGSYDMRREAVQVSGPVRFAAKDGYVLTANNVAIDLKGREIDGTAGVSGQLPIGNFSANRMTADLDSRIVRLTGNARLRVDQR